MFGKGHIVLNNVWAKYPSSEKFVVNGISIEFLPGEKIGIIGRTGAGKTSMIKMISRLMNITEGSIFIDGFDISKMDLKLLRNQLTVIHQKP